MVRDPIAAVEQRDEGLQKLRDLTTICALWAAMLLAAFSVIAAVTIPGQSQASSNSSNGSDSSAGLFTDDGEQLQAPAAGSFPPYGGRPIAVSGGSH
jgi:hypothetical protein